MDAQILGDQLHRSVKLALDSGEAATLAEAEQLFQRYRLIIEVGPDIARSATLQAGLLTAVNTGRRCFLGGVSVAGDLSVPLRIPWRRCATLAEAVVDLQGHSVSVCPPNLPRIVIGDAGSSVNSPYALRATFDGWSGGVIPLEEGRLAEQHEFIPSGVLAGALAVAEVFQGVRGSNAQAGHRAVGLSLWRPEAGVSWLNTGDPGPALEFLPAKLWLIGLGHLGQAFLWMLGLLPYAQPDEVELVLQDTDVLVTANDSTSLLTSRELLGQKKTRALARWCEERGFRTRIQERRFAPNFRIAEDEPQIALCGVDNPQARAALEEVGFRQIIEVGLGHGTQEYLAFQLHTFPASRAARTRWGGTTLHPDHEAALDQPAYQRLASDGLDQCGLTLLAGRAVGASFVGAATAALVAAELVRMLLGAHRYEIIDGTLRSLMYRQALISDVLQGSFNPGYTRAAIMP